MNGVHVIFGGTQLGGYGAYYGDLWTSKDDGATWSLLANNTVAGAWSNTAMIFDRFGYLYMFGGENGGVNNSNQYNWAPIEGRSTVQLAPIYGSSSSSTAGAAPVLTSSSAAPVVLPSSSSTGAATKPSGAATTTAAYGLGFVLLLAAVVPILL
jgi:hypothetical protein